MNKSLHFLFSTLLFLGIAWARPAAGYTIYPIPQSLTVNSAEEQVSFTSQVCIVSEEGIDSYTVDRAAQVLADAGLEVSTDATLAGTISTIYLGVYASEGTVDALAAELEADLSVFEKSKYDRHILLLYNESDHASVLILGEDTDATFCGLASLEQMFDEGTDALSTVTIADYADLKSRGIVEGYYGYPYSVDVKKDLMRFMMRYKMNTYLYGAKSDPYHSDYCYDPYPTSVSEEEEANGWLSQDMVKELTDLSHETKVNFIWAIHPGDDFLESSTVIDDIMTKYASMYELGVRQFAVFVDDVSVPSEDEDLVYNATVLTNLQQAIEAKWNTADAEPADTVRPLHFVPQIYCYTFASSASVYQAFFEALAETPENVTIYTTGYSVWAVPNSSDLYSVRKYLGRSAGWWWNYPCNDNADGQIYPMDMYQNFYDMPAVSSTATLPSTLNYGTSLVSNPMQQGEVAKIPLFSVADYAWNHKGFDNESSWEASFAAVLPDNEEARTAYRALAPYLTYNDPDEVSTLIEAYKSSDDPTDLEALMDAIVANCDIMIALQSSETENEVLLYNDLEPWLNKLRAMAVVIRDLLEIAADESTDASRWEAYLAAMKPSQALTTAEEYTIYSLSGMGSSISVTSENVLPSELYLSEFVTYLLESALDGYFTQDDVQTKPVSFSNVDGLTANISGSSKYSIIQSTPFTLETGEYIGTKLVYPTLGTTLSVSDTLLTNHSVVYSADGKTWTRITEATTEPDSYVRFLAVVNDQEEPVSIKLVQKSMQISVPEATKVKAATIPDGTIYDSHTADLMYDGDYTTYTCLYQNQQSGDAYMLQLSKTQAIQTVRLGMGTTNSDYPTGARMQISTDGSTWTTLKVKGTSSTKAFSINLDQVYTISDECVVCDFDGEGQEALYVRLYVHSPNTSKWLRLYEIEVNPEGSYTQLRCEDEAGLEVSETYDADASTSSDVAVGNELIYRFQNVRLLESVTLYCDPETLDGVSLEISNDGETYTSIGEVTSSVEQIDFSDYPSALAMRLTWSGTTVPAIYEILENASTTATPEVTSIEALPTAGTASGGTPTLKLTDGKLIATSPTGIASVSMYGLSGQLLVSQNLGGATTATLPRICGAGSATIVKLTLADGTIHTFKVM